MINLWSYLNLRPGFLDTFVWHPLTLTTIVSTGPADQATAGPKLQKPTTQNFSLLFIYTLIVLYQQQYNLLFV